MPGYPKVTDIGLNAMTLRVMTSESATMPYGCVPAAFRELSIADLLFGIYSIPEHVRRPPSSFGSGNDGIQDAT